MSLAVKSLSARQYAFSEPQLQLNVLQQGVSQSQDLKPFYESLSTHGLYPLKPKTTNILQVNVGKMCNQTCKHCHVDAGPDRKEIMTRETMQHCLDALSRSPQIGTVDLTGGAPEMNPDFRWFVEELTQSGKKVIVRCNLTITVANRKYNDLPEFFKRHQVHVISSLPYFAASRTDAQLELDGAVVVKQLSELKFSFARA